MRSAHQALALLGGLVLACGSSPASEHAANGGGAASGDGMAGGGASVAGAAAVGAAAAGAASSNGSERPPLLTEAERETLRSLSPSTLPGPPPDVSNRFADDAAAAAFGHRLFFDAAFSGKLLDGDNDGSVNALGKVGDTGKVACAGCHVPSAGFLDDRSLGRQISLAAGWGRRKAPSLIDVAQAPLYAWDGRHDSLYNQPFGPLESPVEMNSSRLFVAEQLYARHRAEYEAIFGEMPPLSDASRFPPLSALETGCHPSTVDTGLTCNGAEHGAPGDDDEFDSLSNSDQRLVTGVVVNMGKALGAYERLLTCGASRFDEWVHGQADALTASEQRGAELFVGRGKCASCHSGPFLSDQKFHDVGLQPKTVAVVFIDMNDQGASEGVAAAIADPLSVRGVFSDGDDGRLPNKADPALAGAFKTPMLRCRGKSPSFMHTAQLGSLADVVAFFARGGDTFGFPGKSELRPLALSAQDQADLVAFLGTLEGPGPAADLLIAP